MRAADGPPFNMAFILQECSAYAKEKSISGDFQLFRRLLSKANTCAGDRHRVWDLLAALYVPMQVS